MTPQDALAAALKQGDIGCETHRGNGARYHLVSDHREDADNILAALAAAGFKIVPIEEPSDDD